MKKLHKIFLLAVGMTLSMSVVMSARDVKKSPCEDFDVGAPGLAFENGSLDFSFGLHNYDMLAGVPLVIEYVRAEYRDVYVGLELNNKALPLSKRLWLINCQIAQK